jgi:hypothetical protein
MKIWLKSVILIWLGVCLLACTSVVEPEAPPSSPTSPPSPTLTSLPQETPVAAPTVSPSPTATVRPTLAPSPTPTRQIDPDTASVSYVERPAWRALLGWPDECEEMYGRFTHQPQDDGDIFVYPVADGQYLAFVTCNIGPYWVEERVYWLDERADPPAAHPLTVPELIQDDAPERGLREVDALHGAFPTYHPDTQTLTNLHAYRGFKDCGIYYKYHLEGARFVLDEARYRDCVDSSETDPSVLNANEWPVIYPLPLVANLSRKVESLPSDLPGEITRLEALPDGGLRLLTTDGYALLRAGAWQPYFLLPSQRFIGVDAAGRVWFFLEEAPSTIFYWDSLAGDQSGSTLIHADAGWMPLDDPATLEGRGVITDDQGQVWLATEQDVRVFAGGRWTIYTQDTLRMPVSSPEVLLDFTLVFAADKKQIWVGECDWSGAGPEGGGGARWLNTVEFAAGEGGWAGAQAYTSRGCVTAITADAGNVWIGTGSGIVLHFDPARKYEQFLLPAPEDYRLGHAVALMLGPDGAPWILATLLPSVCGGASCESTMGALYHFQDGTWIEVTELPDYPAVLSTSTQPVLFDRAGTPWLFIGGTPVRITDGHLEQLPAAGLNVLAATADAARQIWMIAQAEEDSSPALWVLESDK